MPNPNLQESVAGLLEECKAEEFLQGFTEFGVL